MNRLRRRCERTLAKVPIPQPFDLDRWCEVIADYRNRRVVLQPMPGLSTMAPCGMWLSAGQTDYVFYEADTSRLHAEHIVLHELGHILSDHISEFRFAEGLLSQLLPDLDPSAVRRVLGRVDYTTDQEEEAEMIASLVRAQAGIPAGATESYTDVDQIAQALGYQR